MGKSLHDFGGLLLGSRLRKVSEALYAGVDEVYRGHGVTLSSRCFPVLFLLRDHGRLGISELATRLGQSHPAVSQMSRKLLQHGLVREWPDAADERRRLLGLSRGGTALMARLAPVWQALVAAVQELEAAHPLSAALTGIDQALAQRSFAQRIRVRLHAAEAAAVEIILFEPRYRSDFKRLNVAWVQRYFRVEPVDKLVLSRPAAIIRAGGSILLARLRQRIIGTCALLREGEHRFELSKMSVHDDYQGLGIGRRLLIAAIQRFEASGGGELFLESNSVLTPALTLYESAGFVHTPRPAGPSPYARANVYMEYRGRAAPVAMAPTARTAPVPRLRPPARRRRR
jgi:GNAT superfamily N-acetyltransferase